MKKTNLVFAGLFCLLLSLGAAAQNKSGADYFMGKWNVLVRNLPTGDAKLFIILEKKDSTITGAVQDSTGATISTLTRVDVVDTSATVYFTAQGYDVNLLMTKKDDDHITGSMMGMFDAEGVRVKMD